MRRTSALIALTGALVAAAATPASADIVSPYGVTVHATPICDGETNTLTLQVRPDPGNADIRIGLRNRETGQDYGYTPFVAGTPVLDWRDYVFPGIGLPDDTGRAEIKYTNVEVRVHYAWVYGVDAQGNPIMDQVEEVLPDQCLI